MSPSYRMFCAEFEGELALSYISFRAGDVRREVCNNHHGPGHYSPTLWRHMLKGGWRVVRVTVTKQEGRR